MTQRINLYKNILRPKETLLSTTKMVRISVAFLILLLLISLIQYLTLYYKMTVLTKLNGREAVVIAQLNEFNFNERNNKNILSTEMNKQIALLEEQKKVIALLATIPRAETKLKFSPFLLGLEESSATGVWLKKFAFIKNGNMIELRGCSTEAEFVFEYLKKLNQAKNLQGFIFKLGRLEENNKDTSCLGFEMWGEKKGVALSG